MIHELCQCYQYTYIADEMSCQQNDLVYLCSSLLVWVFGKGNLVTLFPTFLLCGNGIKTCATIQATSLLPFCDKMKINRLILKCAKNS